MNKNAFWVLFFSLSLCALSNEAGGKKTGGGQHSLPQKKPAAAIHYLTEADNLREHILTLASDIGERTPQKYENLNKSANYIKKTLSAAGYSPEIQTFTPKYAKTGELTNIIAEKKGSYEPEKIIICTAHYDSPENSSGTDNNASGVALLLELAKLNKNSDHDKTIRFVASTAGEPPFFKTSDMGAYRYAKLCHEKKEEIEAVISLDSLGSFSQKEPAKERLFPLSWLFPPESGTLGVISDFSSMELRKTTADVIRGECGGLETAEYSAPALLVKAVTFSDQWAYWNFGYKAVMITDGSLYGPPSDNSEKLDYSKMEKILDGLNAVLKELSK